MIPVGLLVGALGMALMGLGLRHGTAPGTVFWISQVCFGFGFGSAFSPLITLALTHVPPADAADASGLLTTMTQLAQVVGVATFGSLYLTLAGHAPSAHALAVTSIYLAAVSVLSAGCAALLPRARRTG
jgi:cyanate permease